MTKYIEKYKLSLACVPKNIASAEANLVLAYYLQ